LVRWTVLGLLLLNLVVAAWFSRHERLVVPSPSPDDKAGARLVLVGEGEPAASRRCLLLGPYGDRQAAGRILADATGLDVGGRILQRDIPSGEDFWVYVPVGESSSHAARLSRELTGAGVESFVVNEGPLAGHVSAGLHRTADAAKSQQQRLQILGYPAEIQNMPRLLREYWLALETPPVPAPEAWRVLLKSAPQRLKRQMPCETVASSGLFP
jgi:hypothetical protein